MADDKPFGGLDSFTPVQSGFTPSANAPAVKKLLGLKSLRRLKI